MPTLIDGSAQGWIAGVNGKAAEAAIAPCKSVRLFIWLVCLNGQEHGHILEKPDPSPVLLWLRIGLVCGVTLGGLLLELDLASLIAFSRSYIRFSSSGKSIPSGSSVVSAAAAIARTSASAKPVLH